MMTAGGPSARLKDRGRPVNLATVPSLTNIPALDVVIGLAFVYFILSLALSSVTETISSLFQVRWKKLQQGLRELFENAGGDAAEGKKLWDTFQKDPRIRALWKQTGTLGARGPSYIPSRVLALTLLDTLAPLDDSPAVGRRQSDAAKGKQMARDHDLVARAERAVGSVKNPLLQKWLLDALTEVDVDREKLLASLESSFDGVMSRVSGWYKRYAAIVVAVLAFIAAAALNVDSYAIGTRLWKDDAVRAAIANQAANVTAAQCPPPAAGTGGGGGASGASGAGGATGSTGASGGGGVSGASGASGASKFSLERATDCITSLRALSLPIGWGKDNRPTGWGWLSKPFGIIVTAFALMLGAPFWFDTLSRLARLRSTGTTPEAGTKKNGG
jgi:hypothetical protein